MIVLHEVVVVEDLPQEENVNKKVGTLNHRIRGLYYFQKLSFFIKGDI